MKVIYLLGFFIVSCAGKHQAISYQQPTSSMCLDGVIYNMIHDGCDNIYIAESHPEGTRILSCRYSYVHKNSQPSIWLENDFYVMSTQRLQEIESGRPLCTDGNLTIVVSEKD